MSEEDTPDSKAEELVLAGSEMAGGLAGGALGLIGGPLGVAGGAIGGVLVARVVKKIGHEILERVGLGHRQVVRAGAAFIYAANDIAERLAAGDTPRDDGFFESEDDTRPEAEELLEGVLLHAANSYEERKVEYLGHLYASIAFDPTTSTAEAHFLIHVAERLTYRQLVLLALLNNLELRTELIYTDVDRTEGTARSSESLIAELDELGHTGIIGVGQQGGAVANINAVIDGGTFASLSLAKAYPTYIGNKLYKLMRLDLIPHHTVKSVLERLRIQ